MVKEHGWYPYEFQSGTTVAVAGEDYVVVASDTRLTENYAILSRTHSNVYKMHNNSLLLSTGFLGDVLTLKKTLDGRIKTYEYTHNKPISTPALAQMISIMMYGRRFFPYYTNTVITGLDTDGKGCIFAFDPVGSMTQQLYACEGSAMPLILPILDAHILGKNTSKPGQVKRTKEETVKMIKDIYMAACERNVEIGDGVVIHVLTKGKGIETDIHPLRKD